MAVSYGLLAKMLYLHRFYWLAAPGRSSDDAIVDRLQAGLDACPEDFRSQQALVLILDAAARPGTERELSGEAAAIDAFVLATRARQARGVKQTPRRPHTRKSRVLAAAVTTAFVGGLCGTAVAGALPAPLQALAHSTFGAPAPAQPAPARPAPDFTVPAGGGLPPSFGANAGHQSASTGQSGKSSDQGKAQATHGANTSNPHPGKGHSSDQANNGGKAKANNGNGKAKGKTGSAGKAKGKGAAKHLVASPSAPVAPTAGMPPGGPSAPANGVGHGRDRLHGPVTSLALPSVLTP